MGAWRLFLAFMVMASHVWGDMVQGPAAYAVWGFFALSGFLMVQILRTKYVGVVGIKNYIANRAIRIYPAYFVALILGVVTLLLAQRMGHPDLRIVNGEFALPGTWWNWLNPLTLLDVFPRWGLPVATSNALAIEVTVYLAMPLLAGSRAAAWLALAIGAFANLKLGFFEIASFPERYATLLPSLLAFSAGALLNHYSDRLEAIRRPVLSVGLWIVHSLLWLWLSSWPWTYGLYVSLLLSLWVVASLFPLKASKLDVWLGDLSYPVYLFHTIVAGWFFLAGWLDHSFLTALVIAGVTVAVSFLVVTLVEKPARRFKLGGRPNMKQGAEPAHDTTAQPV